MLIQTYIHKILKAMHLRMSFIYWTTYTHIIFWLNGVNFGKSLRALGRAKVNISPGGKATIGKRFLIRTGLFYTEVGSIGSRLLVGSKGVLTIGNNVGMSNATIVADESITIGNNVTIGGGVQIFDTNFHSTDPAIRTCNKELDNDVKTAPIIIGDNVFIGTNSIIGKGVTIGDNAIIAAGSIVIKSIPPNETWGGNPAIKIK